MKKVTLRLIDFVVSVANLPENNVVGEANMNPLKQVRCDAEVPREKDPFHEIF
jgi:hypothetical protein